MVLKKGRKESERAPCKDRKSGIAVVGNMNVGKTTLFSEICSSKSQSVNIPGNTVAINSGNIRGTEKYALDTPGICSIFSTNEDERASRDILLPQKMNDDFIYDIKGIILVADAKNMKRSIAIALQYAEYDLPMLFDINMIDEASSRGIKIDTEKLSEMLGIDVCTTIARERIGVSKVISGLSDLKRPKKLIKYPDWIEQFLEIVTKLLGATDISPRAIGLLLLAEDRAIDVYIDRNFGPGMLTQLKNLADHSRTGGHRSYPRRAFLFYSPRSRAAGLGLPPHKGRARGISLLVL